MLRRLLFPIFTGLAGCAVLVVLGFWQLDRLSWKQGILSEIEARLDAPEMPVPTAATAADESDIEYRRVTFSGMLSQDELHVLDSGTAAGTGYRAISALTLENGARILIDKGLLPLDLKDGRPVAGAIEGSGTLLWPDDRTDSTPEPDLEKNIWFARDLEPMAARLGTAPLLVVVSTMAPVDSRLTPLPVRTANIKNDHLEYAITWFSLAIIWASMSLFLIYRTLRRKDF